MKPKLSLPAFLIASYALVATASAQIAITEFFANPDVIADADGEFVELFNYATGPVDLNGWTLTDEDVDKNTTISGNSLIMAPGSYLVLARDKAQIEADYFGGAVRPDIIEITGTSIGNATDELILSNSTGEVIWSIAYPNGEVAGVATFLSEDDFSTTIWGTKSAPGIDFDDIDPASDTLGYQNNDTTTDPQATTTSDGNTASPLAGFYSIGGGGGPVTPADFRILSIVTGTVTGTYDITFESEASALYSLESGTDLTGFTAVVPVTSTGSTTTVTATPGESASRGFYRISKGIDVVGP